MVIWRSNMKFIRLGRDFLKKLKEDHINAYAAQTAYFMILSFIPFIMMLLTLIKYTPVTKADLLTTAVDILPSSIDPMVISIIDEVYNKSSAVISISAITAAWSAGKGVMSIIQALNTINDVEEERGYILVRLRAAFYMVIFVVAVVLTLIIIVFGNKILLIIERQYPLVTRLTSLLAEVKNFAVLGVLTLLFWIMFKFIPRKKMKKSKQLPGAVMAAVAWTIFSFGFSLYIDVSSGFANMYGSLTTIILVMLWLYGCMYIMLVGAEINSYFQYMFQEIDG
ncbi:YihY/virulence factor BrkB family protein [Candidatus Galacturonibacter soehngenii]|uniref:YihY/virulence factor BrkB family protein n=2 Tax=Candidatus Galacturonatibacter soehngenii TaxID=2307010 RepID=A0A7V7QLU5_9FIRM|nr:YihY/virulence factor BrkB family protein [Candidatus Galacturonibacter soehngenii]